MRGCPRKGLEALRMSTEMPRSNGAPMTVDMRGRVALVTGAASGIGLGAAQLLAQSGATVVLADRNLPGARAAADALRAAGHQASALHVDVASSDAVDGMVAAAIAQYAAIDILVHCAGGSAGGRKNIVDLTDEEWHTVIRDNLDGTMFVTRAVARTMIPRRAGTMIVIASDRGLYGDRGKAGYASSKGGVIALVKTLALELGQYQITVNALNPGTTDTPATAGMSPELRAQRLKTDPLGKMSTTAEVAQEILFLAGPASAFMTGQLITTRMRVG